MKRAILMLRIALSVLAAAPAAVVAQAPTGPARDALLDRLEGRWVATGMIAGKPITHDIDATWVLAHQYLLVHEVSREKDAHGGPQYEAFVYVGVDRATAGEYNCLWLDSTTGAGLVNGISCHARLDAGRIPFVFRDKAGRVDFTNTFAYDRASDTWTWSLDNVRDGKPSPFARMKLQKE
jgi:hypothetical protein